MLDALPEQRKMMVLWRIARQRGRTGPCLRRGTRPIAPQWRRTMSENRVAAVETTRSKIAAAAAAVVVVAVPSWGGILTAVVCTVV